MSKQADWRVGHFNNFTGKTNGWGGVKPNYFFEEAIIGGIAAKGVGLLYEGAVAKFGSQYLYHYTSETAVQNIMKYGLSTEYSADGYIYLTNKSTLSGIQAQIELALPANRALPTSILKINVSGLDPAIIKRVQGNLNGMGAGGGTEFLFNQNIPANLIKVIK